MAVQTETRSRRALTCAAIVAATLLVSVVNASGADAGRVVRRNEPDMVDAKTLKAIKAGSRYLARTQGNDGSWLSAGGYGGSYPIVMTSLCGLALMAGGSTPESSASSPSTMRRWM